MNLAGAVTGACLVAAALLPLCGVPTYWLFILTTGFLSAAVATAWALLALGGVLSFGHAAFFGVGAYGVGLSAATAIGPGGAIVVGAVVAGGLGLAMGAISSRLTGMTLALATLAVAELVRGIALGWTGLTGGGAGVLGIPAVTWAPARTATYYAALSVLAVAIGVLAGVRRTRAGLALTALGENEARAQVLGIQPLPWRLLAFGLSGVLTGLAGGVYAATARSVDVEGVFGRFHSILPVVTATVGGVHTLAGPALATIGLHLLSEVALHPYLPTLHQVPYAIVLVAVILRRGRRRARAA